MSEVIGLLLLCGVIVLATSARAESIHTVMHEGSMYAVDIVDQTLTISFMDPPADLRELGATRGTVLLKGKWLPTNVLEGEAYVFAAGCAPIAYPVRGVIDQGGQLVVIGPQPIVAQSCAVTGSQWNDGAIMQFTSRAPAEQARPERKREAKAKEKPKSKPKLAQKAGPRQQPRQQATVRQPWENQWQWQWR